MKNLIVILLLLITAGLFAQNLGRPQIIGQSTRNQKVGKGIQVEDTLLAKGINVLSNLGSSGNCLVGSINSGQLRKIKLGAGVHLSNDTLIAGLIDTAYIAVITQSSTSAPVASVRLNTYPGTFTWARVSAGIYTVTYSHSFSAFPVIFIGSSLNGGFANIIYGGISDVDQVTIKTVDIAGTLTDGILSNTAIKISIYP